MVTDKEIREEFRSERVRPDGNGTYLYFDLYAAIDKYGDARISTMIAREKSAMLRQTN